MGVLDLRRADRVHLRGVSGFLWLRAKLAPKPIKKEPIEPTISIVIAVYNEAARIPAKLQTIAELDYPKDKVEIVIALRWLDRRNERSAEEFATRNSGDLSRKSGQGRCT